LQYYGKFVAAGPEDRVGRPEPLVERFHQPHERSVPGLVAVGVVDDLQAVEVDDHDGQREAEALGARHRTREHRLQGASIARSGQRVHHGRLFETLEGRGRRRVGDDQPSHEHGRVQPRRDCLRDDHFERVDPVTHQRGRTVGPSPRPSGHRQLVTPPWRDPQRRRVLDATTRPGRPAAHRWRRGDSRPAAPSGQAVDGSRSGERVSSTIDRVDHRRRGGLGPLVPELPDRLAGRSQRFDLGDQRGPPRFDA
jgi:hypothetical protein